VSLSEIAQRVGTPTYVYEAAKIVERINDLKQFDVIRFAQKACSNIAILDLARRHRVLVDAVSAGEIHRALKAGYEASKSEVRDQKSGLPSPTSVPQIIYTADIFDH